MCPAGSQPQASDWLLENGPRELELLFRTIVFNASTPILITDNRGTLRDISAGAGTLLGLSRQKIIGHGIEEFTVSDSKPHVSQLWSALDEVGEQQGPLWLARADGNTAELAYTAKGNVLPKRNVL